MGFRTGISERQRRFGEELRRIRDAAGLSALEIGEALGVKGPNISHTEAGRLGLNSERLNAWLDICKVTDPEYRAGLIAMSESTGKGWWTDFKHDVIATALDLAEAEAGATSLDSYETLLIPGLLQTRAYSEVIHGYNDRKVEFRHQRQTLLTGEGAPPFRAVIHEAALHMMYGGPTVMRDQLSHLVEMGKLPNVTIQILPFDCTTYASTDTPFVLLRGTHSRLHTVLLEHPHGETFVGDPESVAAFDQKFDRIRGLALPPLSASSPMPSATYRDSLGSIQHIRYKLQGR
ncbi:helix-turn-helix transcriptional regulator [Kitasatospora sp. NPDC096077]|uniref:helix-turn-helix domain-containing protein n=1 Tax=Kitasatospora sp. NPDC096077 TaxID=3155544 RepID=UPI00332DA7D6